MSNPVKDFVAGIVEQARGPVQADRRISESGAMVGGQALPLTENDGNDTRRVFVVGFDTVGDSAAVVR